MNKPWLVPDSSLTSIVMKRSFKDSRLSVTAIFSEDCFVQLIVFLSCWLISFLCEPIFCSLNIFYMILRKKFDGNLMLNRVYINVSCSCIADLVRFDQHFNYITKKSRKHVVAYLDAKLIFSIGCFEFLTFGI